MLDANTIILVAISAAFIAVLIAVIVFMGYLRKILSIASYMAPNATIFAIGSKYTENEYIDKLLEMSSVQEVLADVKKEGYHIDDPSVADIQIEKDLIDMLRNVIATLPEGVRQFAEVYMLKYEANIVKRILRAKNARLSASEIYRVVYPGDVINDLVINHMIEATGVEDAIAALDATPFRDAVHAWAERNSLFDVDVFLDKVVFEKILEAKSTIDEDSREAVEKFSSILVDVYNLKTIVRAKFAGAEGVENYLVEGGYELSEWKLKNMAEARTVEEMLTQLEGTEYAFVREYRNAFEIELALDRYLLNKVNEIGMVYAVSAGPAVMFLVAKEYEARNLKAIIKGMLMGVSRDKIRSMLVGGAM
ncbi:MAG: V-type ATP synthase subunit C [Euryarchaeota archaeon]|nr:V-type ATP synthase subunit C [Euryarchaeota archaeon]